MCRKDGCSGGSGCRGQAGKGLRDRDAGARSIPRPGTDIPVPQRPGTPEHGAARELPRAERSWELRWFGIEGIGFSGDWNGSDRGLLVLSWTFVVQGMCLTEKKKVWRKPPKWVFHLKMASKIQVEKSLFPPGLLCHLILQNVYIISGELRRLWKPLICFSRGFVNDNSTPWSLVAEITKRLLWVARTVSTGRSWALCDSSVKCHTRFGEL